MTADTHRMEAVSPPPTLHLDILVYQDDGYWVGHCVQLDLVACGDDADEAFKEANRAAVAAVEHAFETDNIENLFQPTSATLMRRMFAARNCGTLTLNLVRSDGAPAVASDPQLQIQRAQETEECEQDLCGAGAP